ncbi:helix-turn-helix domain-containing protein [Lutibacter citreus]|uniref:helix-turn-helix domain-containing protein n=1 Tax=Lutibacter citreus TaxID=2138210 RepID=UPI000DBE7C40|nr:helix-turn-helix domain-containing protein [Lutibacter citreus]
MINTINKLSDEGIKVLSEKILENILPYLENGSRNNFKDFEIERPISITELSNYLGYAKQTIYGKVNRNEIPFHKKDGKLYFLLSEIKQWLISSSKVNTPSEKLDKFLSKKSK